jgi:hypothetical protein
VYAITGVQAGVSEAQALHRFSTDDVGVDDFIHIGFRHKAVPDPVGIDNEVWSMLALVKTAHLVGPYPAFQSALEEFLFEQFLQFALRKRITASSRMALRTLIPTHENMFFEFRHRVIFSDFA